MESFLVESYYNNVWVGFEQVYIYIYNSSAWVNVLSLNGKIPQPAAESTTLRKDRLLTSNDWSALIN